MKLGKVTGPDSITVELLEALEDYGIDKIATLLNKIYDTSLNVKLKHWDNRV